ncbi:MAG: hypothetical protein AAB112_04230, partial [Thermodesulfobacteriota bacterium]
MSLTWLTTDPPRCDRPYISPTTARYPWRCASTPNRCAATTFPWPPTPVINTFIVAVSVMAGCLHPGMQPYVWRR